MGVLRDCCRGAPVPNTSSLSKLSVVLPGLGATPDPDARRGTLPPPTLPLAAKFAACGAGVRPGTDDLCGAIDFVPVALSCAESRGGRGGLRGCTAEAGEGAGAGAASVAGVSSVCACWAAAPTGKADSKSDQSVSEFRLSGAPVSSAGVVLALPCDRKQSVHQQGRNLVCRSCMATKYYRHSTGMQRVTEPDKHTYRSGAGLQHMEPIVTAVEGLHNASALRIKAVVAGPLAGCGPGVE